MQTMDEIYQKYAQMVYKYLLSLCHNSDIAEELTQETFYQAIKGIDKFDGTCKVTTWLCAIAKRQLHAYYRKHPVTDEIEDISVMYPSAEIEVMDAIGQMELLKRLHVCPEPFREILYLRIFGNLSFKDIGEIIGKTENWARVNYYRGKERLRKELEESEE